MNKFRICCLFCGNFSYIIWPKKKILTTDGRSDEPEANMISIYQIVLQTMLLLAGTDFDANAGTGTGTATGDVAIVANFCSYQQLIPLQLATGIGNNFTAGETLVNGPLREGVRDLQVI